jgi:hypothetical protein
MEMQKQIHTINGKSNNKKKLTAEMANYSSTARNLLRMMWLLTFIKVTFTRCQSHPNESLSSIFGLAYESAFGSNHSWLVRKSAKLAMMASQNRQKFIEILLQQPYDEKLFQTLNAQFLEQLVPVHDFLWQFYRDNGIDKL